nr:S-adenosylmethionine decarboxylase [Auraticoccus cholistanensis]
MFEVSGADPARLDDLELVQRLLARVVGEAGLTPVAETAHRFSPQGLSLAVLLAESHIAAHTWPEAGTAYLTLTTCRPPDPDFGAATAALVREGLAADRVELRELV